MAWEDNKRHPFHRGSILWKCVKNVKWKNENPKGLQPQNGVSGGDGGEGRALFFNLWGNFSLQNPPHGIYFMHVYYICQISSNARNLVSLSFYKNIILLNRDTVFKMEQCSTKAYWVYIGWKTNIWNNAELYTYYLNSSCFVWHVH